MNICNFKTGVKRLNSALRLCRCYLSRHIHSYVDITTLYAEVKSPSDYINVANSLKGDLFKIKLWCSTWGIKLNPRKTHSITISRSNKN